MNAKKLLSTLMSAAMAVTMLAGCFGGGGSNYSRQAADAANAAQSTVVFSTDATLAKSLQDALENFTQLDDIKDAMEADENLKPLLTSGYDLDVVAEQGEDAEAAAKAIAEKYIVSIVSGKKAEGKIAMVLHDGNGYYYVAVLTYGSGGSGSGGGAGGGSGSGDDDNRPGPGDDDEEENGVYDVDAKALDGNGTVKADKTTVKAGETVTITVTPKDGYKIDKIDYKGGTFNYVRTESGSGSLVYTMSNVTGDVEFYVTFFEAAPDTSTVTFTVTGEGTVTNTANNSEIENGDTLEMVPADKMTFKVNPDQNYEAVVTNEGCTVVDNKDGTYTLSNVTDGATVTVTFEEIVYEITVSSSSNGRTIVSTSKVHPAKGEDSVTITAKPDSGYEVDEVIVTDSKGNKVEYEDIGNGDYIVRDVKDNLTVSVTFKRLTYTVKVVTKGGDANCTVTPMEGTVSVENPNFEFTVTVSEDYSAQPVVTSGSAYVVAGHDGKSYTVVTDVTGDVTVTVNFVKKQPVVTALYADPDTITRYVGQTFKKDDLKIYAVYSNDSANPVLVDIDDCKVTGAPNDGELTAEGTYTVKVTFGNQTAEVTVIVKKPYVTGIKVTNTPAGATTLTVTREWRTSHVDEVFRVWKWDKISIFGSKGHYEYCDDIELRVNYSDGSHRDINKGNLEEYLGKSLTATPNTFKWADRFNSPVMVTIRYQEPGMTKAVETFILVEVVTSDFSDWE